MQISEVMTSDPVCASPDTTIPEIARLMASNRCGAIPILENGALTGIVTERDVVCRTLGRGLNPLKMTASAVMTANVITIHHEQHAEAAETLMKKEHLRRLPVVDGEGRLVGIVSRVDLDALSEEETSEEIVSKITRHVPKKTSRRFRTWL